MIRTSSYRPITIRSIVPDDICGGEKIILWRALQPLNKDGRDSKRAARKTGAYLVIYSDKSWRYYGPRGSYNSISLAREHVSSARIQAEIDAPDFDNEYYWDEA